MRDSEYVGEKMRIFCASPVHTPRAREEVFMEGANFQLSFFCEANPRENVISGDSDLAVKKYFSESNLEEGFF